MANKTNITGSNSGDFVQLDNVILDVYSEQILFEAQPNLRFEQIAVKQTDLSVLPGQKVKFLKYNALSGSSEITETSDLESGSISTATLEISVGEHGKALRFSEALLRQSITDVLGNASKLLGNHYGTQRDSIIRTALMGGTNVMYADSTGAAANSARSALDASDVFDVNLVRETVEFLATNKAPKLGDAYVAFIHPHQAKNLRKDPAWVNVQLYGNPDAIYNGESGRIEDLRFVETTNLEYIPINTQDIYVDNVDSGTNTAIAANSNTAVYRSIALGDFAVGLAESLPVEMRDNGVENYGRYHSIAYYGIWGAGLLETGHSVILETA